MTGNPFDFGSGAIWVNAADWEGGGIYMSGATGLIGGLHIYANTGSGVYIYANHSGRATFWLNDIAANSALYGGGLGALMSDDLDVASNSIRANNASYGGGGAWFIQANGTFAQNIVRGNQVASGSGGGAAIIESPAQLINNTIADNTGDGIYVSAAHNAVIVNNILSGNSRYGLSNNTMTQTTGLVADYNDYDGNNLGALSGVDPGTHDQSFSPAYVASGDMRAYYHIQATSPLSTTGSTALAPQYDIDGEWRRTRGTVSMGADEIPGSVQHVYLPLVLKAAQ